MSCTLEKIVRDSNVDYSALKLIEQQHFIKGKIPFFSFYQSYDELSGDKWMTSYKSNEQTVYYVRQYKIKRNEHQAGGSNCNPIFLPHLWNTKLDSVAQSTDYDKRGKLTVHSQEPNGSFTNIDLTSKDTFGAIEYDYNDTKHYIIHKDGRLSNGTNIPESVVSKILNGTRLFITFKWSDVDEREVIDPNETFYGIYDFVSSDKTPMFKIENVDNGIYITNFQYDKDFEKQFPQNKVTEDDKTEICKLMQQFMDKVKPQGKSVAGGKFAFPPLSTLMPGANANLNPMPPQPPTSTQNNIIPIATQMFDDQKHYGESISKQGITTTDLLDVTKCYYWNESDNGTNTANNGRVTQTHSDALTKFNERRKILFESDFFIVVAPHPTEQFPCVYVFSKNPTTDANYKKIEGLTSNSVEMREIKDPTEINKMQILGDKSVSIDGYSIMHIFCRHYGDNQPEYTEDTDFKKMYLPQYKNNQESTNGPNWVDLLVNLVPEMFDKIAFVESTTIDYIKNSHDVINSDKSNSILTDLISAKPNFFIEYTLNISIFWTAIINDSFSNGTYVYVCDATNNVKTQIKIGEAIENVKVLFFEISKDATLKYSTLYYCPDENKINIAKCEDMFLYNNGRPLPQFTGTGTGTGTGTRSNVKKTTKEIPLYELNDIDLLYLQLKNIKHVPLLGKNKMVATFDSTAGGEPDNNFIRNVRNKRIDSSSLEKKVNEWITKTKGDNIDFKIYIDDSWHDGSGVSSGAASKLVFYSNKYLTQLATLSSKSVNDLLKLCTTKQNNGTFDYELVIIAFNYGGEITTEEGKQIFEEYVKKYGEYKSETTSIRISPTLGPTSVANPGPILGHLLVHHSLLQTLVQSLVHPLVHHRVHPLVQLSFQPLI